MAWGKRITQKILSRVCENKKAAILVFFFLGAFFLVQPARAVGGVPDFVWSAIAYLAEAICSLLSSLLLWVVHFMIQLSGYNGFLDAKVVSVGWKLVRDVANMFYILLMLVIAFGTMLKSEQYSWKKMLPRLIFTAVLVNFSKTIIGLLIDFGQVVMLTFVNAYAATAGGNFVAMFHLEEILNVAEKGAAEQPSVAFSSAIGYLLGALILAVSVVVTAVFALILLFRIVVLWILIVLSPMAFLLGTFQRGQQYYSDWWKQLVNQIIVGPLVAFFLWLSLATMGSGNQIADIDSNNVIPDTIRQGVASEQERGQKGVGSTEVGKWENLGSVAVAIAMLFVGLKFISDLGVAGAGLASGAASKMKGMATSAVKKAAVMGGLTYLTGGIGTALLARGGLKGTMDILQRMPLIGKPMQALRKKAGEYGLGESGKIVRGIHARGTMPLVAGIAGGAAGLLKEGAGWAAGKTKEGAGEGLGRGKKGWKKRAAGIAEMAGAGLATVIAGAAGVGMGVTAGGARQMRAEALGAARKEGREGLEARKELKMAEQVAAGLEGSYIPGADKNNQRLYRDQAYILKNPAATETAKQKDPLAFSRMVAGFQNLADKTGNTEDATGVLKDFHKKNPHYRVDTPATKTEPAKTRAEHIQSDLKAMSQAEVLQMNHEAFADDTVVGNLRPDHAAAVFEKGSDKQRAALAETILRKETGKTKEELDPKASGFDPLTVGTAIENVIGRLPEGMFGQLRDLFSALSPALQAQLVARGTMKPEDVTVANLAGTNGENFAEGVARTANDETLDKLQKRLGDALVGALKGFTDRPGVSADPRVLTILAASQRSQTDLLNLMRTGKLKPPELSRAAGASNANLMLRRLTSADLVDGAGKASSDIGTPVYQNISISVLQKLVTEANKTGSPEMRDMVATLCALVKAQIDSGARPGEKERLMKLLTGSQIGDIDWGSKTVTI
ncbi:MAG: hypothetical protein HY982_02250 [Candidatus Magasanikbacteria bacterium]|nr:hypothetical protein [Candidatus Magasanikbacteria bacterium]